MTYRSQKLKDSANGQSCVRCGVRDGTIVGAHYTGARRYSYGGGYGHKVHDFMLAHLCGLCHQYMDQLSRDKEQKWLHSEEMLHLCALTLARWFEDGTVAVKGAR